MIHQILTFGSTVVVPVAKASLYSLALCGFGNLLLSRFDCRSDTSLRPSERLVLQFLLGMMGWSTLLLTMGLLRMLWVPLIYAFEFLFATFFVKASWGSLEKPSLQPLEKFAMSLVLFGFALFFYDALSSMMIHPDAIQYHFGLPSHYLRLGAIQHMPTVGMSGGYLGADILLMGTPDIANPLNPFPARVMATLFGLLLPISTYLCARRVGLSRVWSLTSILLLYSLQGIPRLSDGKNDGVSAAMQILWLLAIVASRPVDERKKWLGLISFVGGFCIAIKLSAAPIVLLVLAYALLLTRARTPKAIWESLALFALPILPWAAVAMSFRGTPVYPFFYHWPDYITQGWASRNVNGLHLSVGSYLSNIVPLILNRNHLIGGNDSFGYFFLAALVLSPLGLLKSKTRQWFWLYAIAATVLFAFSVYLFEGRFLSRYFFVVPAAIFVYAALCLHNLGEWLGKRLDTESSRRWASASIAMAIGIGAFTVGPLPPYVLELARDPQRISYMRGKQTTKEILSLPGGTVEYNFVDQVNRTLLPGERVIINDAMILYYTVDVLNLHSLHSAFIRFDQVDLPELEKILETERVKAAVIRYGISGLHPTLLQYLKKNMVLVNSGGGYEYYTKRALSF